MNDTKGTDTVKTQILFEPLLTGVRCAAIDENGRTLWGYVAGKENFRECHQLVAIYDELSAMLEERLLKYGKMEAKVEQPTGDDLRPLIDKATTMLSKLRSSYSPDNLPNSRSNKSEKAPIVRTAVKNLITTLELLERGSKPTKGIGSDELNLD
jgi:hypothetical protein